MSYADEVPDLLPALMERIMWGMRSPDSDIKDAAITAVSTAAAAVEAKFTPFAEHVVPVLAGFMQQTEVSLPGPILQAGLGMRVGG